MKTLPNCKINLGLRVLRKRDDGYHDLESVFLPVPLCDELEIVPSDSFAFQLTGLPLEANHDNLVIRAYRLVQQQFPDRVGNVSIRLVKQIPFGAGLGGGSSDAASTILLLNQIFDLKMSIPEMKCLAARLGADCVFFIDNVPSLVSGIGDILSPLPFNPINGYKLLLLKPPIFVSTAEAYSLITPRHPLSSVPEEPSLADLLKKPISSWKNEITNDFESSVFRIYPAIHEIKNSLYAQGALYASMSGSGSALFGLFDSSVDIDNIMTFFKDRCYVYSFDFLNSTLSGR